MSAWYSCTLAVVYVGVSPLVSGPLSVLKAPYRGILCRELYPGADKPWLLAALASGLSRAAYIGGDVIAQS